MAGYEPVTIESVCNAGVDAIEDAAGDLPLGRVELRGLPFLVGSDTPSQVRCFVDRPRRSRSSSAGRRGG